MEAGGKRGQSRYKWLVLTVSLFAFVAYAFAFQSVPPLIRSIRTEFNIPSDAQAALLMSIVLVPGIFLSLPAGFWIGKYGVRQVGALSLIGVTVSSLVTASASSFLILLVGRLILGIGGAFVMTTTPAIIAQWFSKEDLGRAMGIFGVNMPLATVIALPTASALLLAFDWRFPFYISFAVGIAATIAFLIVVRDGPFAGHNVRANVREAVANSEIWKVGMAWLFFNAAALSFTTWAPTLFEEFQKIPNVQASFLASLLMWSAVFCVPLHGYLSDKAGRRKPFVLLGFVLMTLAFALIGFTSGVTLVVSILLLGITAAMIPAVVSALPAQVLGPTLASLGFGITATCLNIGAAVAQPFIGFVRDTTQSYTPCLLGMAVLAAIGAIVAYTLKTA
jgi:MFS family permease